MVHSLVSQDSFHGLNINALKLFILHSHTMARVLTQALGMAQTRLLGNYARTLTYLLEQTKLLNLNGVDDCVSILRNSRLVEHCRFEGLTGSVFAPTHVLQVYRSVASGEVDFVIEGYKLAPRIYSALNLHRRHSGDLDPLAMIGMVALALEKGWKPDRPLFDYVRTTSRLTYFTEDGSRTRFEIL